MLRRIVADSIDADQRRIRRLVIAGECQRRKKRRRKINTNQTLTHELAACPKISFTTRLTRADSAKQNKQGAAAGHGDPPPKGESFGSKVSSITMRECTPFVILQVLRRICVVRRAGQILRSTPG